MEIETVDDLANQIADWLGVYGCCKHGDGCDDPNPLCCRIGFMMTFPDRIRAAVDNDNKLEKIFYGRNTNETGVKDHPASLKT